MSRTVRRSAALSILIICAFAASPHGATERETLSSGWSSMDIGKTNVSGTLDATSDTLVVRGAGTDVGSTSDGFYFAYREISGDLDFTVRLAHLEAVHPWAKAGIMIRDSFAATANHASVFATAAKGVAFQVRTKTRGPSARTVEGAARLPVWLRLVRSGDTVQAYNSPDGTSWVLAGSTTVQMSTSVYVGLAVTSHDPRRLATASFTDVRMLSHVHAEVPLPSPWAAADLGEPRLAGAAILTEDTFRVTAAGTGIGGESDQFHFMYQPIVNDAEIVARVVSLEQGNEWSKAGLMIREALAGSGAHASILSTRTGGSLFQRRLEAGLTTSSTPAGTGTLPLWLRLVREGDLFSAYESQDGSDWTLVGSDVIPMAATVFVGLAVTSHDAFATATAAFRNVTVGSPARENQPPSVSISTPVPGARFTAPADITIAAAAGDVDGAVTRVDFYAGSELLGSDTIHPFAITWSKVDAGIYTLSAVAHDNAGAHFPSAEVTIAVSGTTAPAILIFVPSADHDGNVTSYALAIHREGEPASAVPAATAALGKPAVVKGEIAVDVTSVIGSLAPGSYYAVVIAIGPGGSTASAPSGSFSR